MDRAAAGTCRSQPGVGGGAAGRVGIRRGRGRFDYTVREVGSDEAAPILKRSVGIPSATRPYCSRFKRHFHTLGHSPDTSPDQPGRARQVKGRPLGRIPSTGATSAPAMVTPLGPPMLR